MHTSIAERELLRNFSAAKLRKVESKTKRIHSFFCRDGVSSPSLMAKLRISERNTKEKLVFLFIPEREELRQGPKYDCNKPGIFELETVNLTVFIPKKMNLFCIVLGLHYL